MALMLHFLFLVTFGLVNVEPLFYFNIGSCVYWILAIFLIQKREWFSAVAILSGIEVCSHQVIAVYVLGWGYGFEYLFIIIPLYIFLIYFKNIVTPLMISVSGLGLYFFSYFYVQNLSTYIPLPTSVHTFLFSVILVSTFFMMGAFSLLFSYAARKAEMDLDVEREKSEKLLLKIFPYSIVQRLKNGQMTIADHFDSATVLFADIVGFTKMSENQTPSELVSFLNLVFTDFDDLVEKYKLEKIKTVGDSYMVASGFPEPRQDYLEAIADLAIDMREAIDRFNMKIRHPIDIRIGIHTGQVTAGVIGTKKFNYDVLGDTVNTASRMESHGIPEKIQASEQTYSSLFHLYNFIERGEIDIKGKGYMKTFFLQDKIN